MWNRKFIVSKKWPGLLESLSRRFQGLLKRAVSSAYKDWQAQKGVDQIRN